MTEPLLVLDVVGLTPRLLAHMPRLPALADDGFQAELGTVLPAVTCSVQSTFLTGAAARRARHRRQRLVLPRPRRGLAVAPAQRAGRRREDLGGGPPAHARLHGRQPLLVVRDGRDDRITVTPRPVYHADGRKSPDCYTCPPSLHDDLTASSARSRCSASGARAGSRRRGGSARRPQRVFARDRPDLTLVYLPHLDYDLQRFGPDGPQAAAAAARARRGRRRPARRRPARGATVVVLSEYGITAVVAARRHQPAAARAPGCSTCTPRPGWSTSTRGRRAPSPSPTTRSPTSTYATPPTCPPCATLLRRPARRRRGPRRDGKARAGLDHPRAASSSLVAEPDAWFTYYYWLDDDRAPGLRPHGRDPPQARLRPGRAVLRPARPAREAAPAPRWPTRSSASATR